MPRPVKIAAELVTLIVSTGTYLQDQVEHCHLSHTEGQVAGTLALSLSLFLLTFKPSIPSKIEEMLTFCHESSAN